MSVGSRWKLGDRVGAVLSATSVEVRLIGYGRYAGLHVPTEEAQGIARLLRAMELAIPIAKLEMDDGSVVWGCECWWGSEENVRTMIKARCQGGARLVQRPIAEWRARTKAEEVQA